MVSRRVATERVVSGGDGECAGGEWVGRASCFLDLLWWSPGEDECFFLLKREKKSGGKRGQGRGTTSVQCA